jgi:hypothetical protein
MATITNCNDGIEVLDSNGDTYFIKYNNCKLIKTNVLKIYDNSENRRGAEAINLTHGEVTNPVTSDLDDLFNTIRNYID